jgi:hypothetical protein
MSNIVNLNDFRRKSAITATEIDWELIDPEKIMRLYNDILGAKVDDIEADIDDATIEFTRFVISKLYDMGADAEDAELADDMIFITMLFTAALTEYFNGAYERSDGNDNKMYRFLNEMKEVKEDIE